MQIELRGNSEIIITGNIKSIDDGMKIKESIGSIQKNGVKSIVIKIKDSFSMTSTVIGYLMKVVNLDKIQLSLIVGDQRLYQLLDELSLVHVLNVRLAEK